MFITTAFSATANPTADSCYAVKYRASTQGCTRAALNACNVIQGGCNIQNDFIVVNGSGWELALECSSIPLSNDRGVVVIGAIAAGDAEQRRVIYDRCLQIVEKAITYFW